VGSAAERQLCPEAAPLQSPAGLRECLQALREEDREIKGSQLLEDVESSFEEKSSQSFTQ